MNEWGEFYVFECDRSVRSALAWFRLGGWMWQGVKVDECRKCPLCFENDGAAHIMSECSALVNERMILNAPSCLTNRWSLRHVVRIKDREVLNRLGVFLNAVRSKRQKKENLHMM